MSEIDKRSVGRPAVNAVPVTLRIPPELLASLDSVIADAPDRPSRPEAIRRILREWLVERGYLENQNRAEVELEKR